MKAHHLAAAALAVLATAFVAGCQSDSSPSDPLAPADTGAALADPIDTTEPVDARPVRGPGITPLDTQFDAAGLGLVTGGCGLVQQPASFSIDVPVPQDTGVLRAAFYWTVRSPDPVVDKTVVINGQEYNGKLLAAFPTNHDEMWAFVFKVGGQNRGPVTAGLNTFEVSGLDIEKPGRVDGLGVIVTHRDPAGFRQIVTQALPEFFHGPQEVDGAVHTFGFAPVPAGTQAELVLFAGDCVDEHADGIAWTFHDGTAPARLVGSGYPVVGNVLNSNRGPQWDIVKLDGLTAPAGARGFSFQVISPHSPRGDSGILAVAALCLDQLPR